ncbi:DUF29 domain-containing protein [Brevundimonas sp. R86498]|uniref:DUF29 domain-containing protein n=1 Tax=Brevundimonas sp. R86498 TaxID=3093845 RepID=UPI0037C96D2B
MADDLIRPANDLYDRDYVAWAESQAAALRAGAAGHRALDYDHLAEEIEDLGKSEQRACRSLVERIIEHMLKLEFIRSANDVTHWQGEILAFRDRLDDTLTPTIRIRIQHDLPLLTARQIRLLDRRGLLADVDGVKARVGSGYSWEQIVDPDWYPVPRDND